MQFQDKDALATSKPFSSALMSVIDLGEATWTFQAQPSDGQGVPDWLPARVPGCVHTDLLTHGLIDDPFHGCNELDLQWIERAEWHYRCDFEVEPGLLEHEALDLVFDGLDTVATVRLNGHLGMAFKPPAITVSHQSAGPGCWDLSLSSAQFEHGVSLEFGQAGVNVSDNAFDLFPGEARAVRVSAPSSATSTLPPWRLRSANPNQTQS